MEPRPPLPAQTETVPASVGGKCKEFFHIPATSVPSECIFSLAGYILRDRRSKILAANVPWPQQQSEGNARSDRCIFDFEDDIVDASSNHFFRFLLRFTFNLFFHFYFAFMSISSIVSNFGGKIHLGTRINPDFYRFSSISVLGSRY